MFERKPVTYSNWYDRKEKNETEKINEPDKKETYVSFEIEYEIIA